MTRTAYNTDDLPRRKRRCHMCEVKAGRRPDMAYYPSQWTNALADLKDAAHDGGIPISATAMWEIRHTLERPGNTAFVSTFGYVTHDREFRVFAVVKSPDDVRNLRHAF